MKPQETNESVPHLLAAIATNPTTKFAQVSSSLLWSLDQAGEVRMEPREIHLPNDPMYRHAVDPLFKLMGSDPDDPHRFFVYVLTKHPDIVVQLGAHGGLTLLPSGPGSFKLT